jgi:hypothetical protein
MEKISPRLKQRILSADPEKTPKLMLIISLTEDADWNEGVRLLREAGLRIESTMEEIRAVTGSVELSTVQDIAGIPAVAFIEMDETAFATDSSDITL